MASWIDKDKKHWREAKRFVQNLLPLACTRRVIGGDVWVAAEPGLLTPSYILAEVGIMGGAQYAWVMAARKLGWKEPA